MANNKITAKRYETAKPEAKRYQISDGGGLALWVYPNGRKSWIYRYRRPSDGKGDYYTIGPAPLAKARAARDECAELLRKGLDPKASKAAARIENVQALTMGSLLESWLAFVRQSGKVTSPWVDRHSDRWRLHLKRSLADLYVRDVTRGHLAGALDAMVRKGIKEETRKALTTLNLMLDYAVTRHHIDANPARLLKPKDFAVTAGRPRERALSLPELRKFWAGIDAASAEAEGVAKTARLSPVTATAFKLLVLTGARRGEVSSMQWSELDLKAATWTLPAARTKNRQAHTVYLSNLAVSLIETLKPINGNSPYVFDSGRSEKPKPMREDTLTQAVDRLRGTPGKTAKRSAKRPTNKPDYVPLLAGLTPFTVHDLRRSAATAWGEHCKADPHVIERMLNHQPLNKLIATYQRQTYADEQKAAWLAWGEIVAHQIAKDPENVTPISVARKAGG